MQINTLLGITVDSLPSKLFALHICATVIVKVMQCYTSDCV